MELRVFTAYNAVDESNGTVVIGHPFSLEKCTCTLEDDPTCIFYTVGYNVLDLCTALGLNPWKPVYLSSAPSVELTVIDNGVMSFGITVLIPVHKTTPGRVGFQN